MTNARTRPGPAAVVLAAGARLGAALALLGCAACASAPTTAGPTPQVEVGTGEQAFEPIGDGATLHFIQGPQGGFHVLGSVRVRGIDPGNTADLRDDRNPETIFRVWRDGSRIDVDAAHFVRGLPALDDSPGWFGLVGRFVILDIATGDALVGASIRLEVEITAADGTRVEDARMVTAQPHPNNP